MMATGSALAVGTWIAPSILSLDRVSAAVGSCGTPPVQVDWTTVAGTFPNSVTAVDGTVVTIVRNDPFGVADPGLFGLAFNGTTSTVDNPLIMAMDNASNGDFTSIVFTFSQSVDLCFTMVDIDAGGNWEDTMLLNGSLGGVPVTLGAGDIVTGPSNTVSGPNTILGTGNAANTTTNGNATVTYPSRIDSLEIRHRDDSTLTGFQYIGIHDLSWC